MAAPERISKMGYLYHKRVSERGKAKEDSWKLYYCVLHGLTLRFYRDRETEKDHGYALTPPTKLADPKSLDKAGFLDVTRCLLAIDYKTQSAASSGSVGERKHIFSLTCQDLSEYRLQVANESAVLTWVARIQSNLEHYKTEPNPQDAAAADDEEERDRLDSLDTMIKSRVNAENKSKRQSLRTRNVLSLVRTPTRQQDLGVLGEVGETQSETTTKGKSEQPGARRKGSTSSSAATSPTRESAEAEAMDMRLPDERLLCLHGQLLARQKLLEQLEAEEAQFLARESDKTDDSKRTLSACVEEASAFKRCRFTTTIRQEYYLVPGCLTSAVSAGDEVTVFGRAKNGRWRCHFQRPGVTILRCAASGKPGYDLKTGSRSDQTPGSGSGGGDGTLPGQEGAPGDGKKMKPLRSTAVLNPSLSKMVTRAPDPMPESPTKNPGQPGAMGKQPVAITTSATTKEYPMVGCLPTSLLQGLGDAERLVDEVAKWQAAQGGSALKARTDSKGTESSSPAELGTARLLKRISSVSEGARTSRLSGTSVQLDSVLPVGRHSDSSVESTLSTSIRQISIPVSVRQLGLEIRVGEKESSDEGSDAEEEEGLDDAFMVSVDVATKPDQDTGGTGLKANGLVSPLPIASSTPMTVSPLSSALGSPMESPVAEEDLENAEGDDSFDMCRMSRHEPLFSASAPADSKPIQDDLFESTTQSLPATKQKPPVKTKQRSRSVTTGQEEQHAPKLLSRVTQFFGKARRESFDLASLSPASARRKSSTTSSKSERRGSHPNTALLSVDGVAVGDSPAGVTRKASSVSAATVQPPLNELRTIRLTGFQSSNPGLSLNTYAISTTDEAEADNDNEESPAPEQQVFASNIEPRSCAEKAGMAIGDAILEVDGAATASLSPDEVMELLEGKGGSSLVKIQFTDGLRRYESQMKLKGLSEKLKSMEKAMERLENCQADVEAREADLATVRKRISAPVARQIQFDVPKRTSTQSFRRSVSTAGRTLSAALWSSSLQNESEARMRSASVSHKLRKAIPEDSDSSDDEPITEEAVL